MITLTARIELTKGGNIDDIELEGGTVNGEQEINISSTIDSVIGKHDNVMTNTFILGDSVLGGGGTYANHLDYFIGRQKSNEDGYFGDFYTLTVDGSNIKSLIIEFNSLKSEFPHYIFADGVRFADDDYKWEIVFDKQSTSHTIAITNWNTPNSPLVITSIYADIEINIDKNNLVNLSRQISKKGNVSQPQYGVTSNHGNINFIDLDETILDLIIQQAIGQNKIDLYINNTETRTQERIGTFYTKEWSYDNDNREVAITIKDLLEDWQSISVAPIYYTPTVSTPKPLSYIYEYLYGITTANGYSMLSLNELDSTTKSILTDTILEYPVLEGGNLWEEWDKLCEAVLAVIYVDKNGKAIFKHSV